MSNFLEHNSSGRNDSGRTSKNINVHQSKSSGNAENILFNGQQIKTSQVIIQQLLTHYFTIMAATSSSGSVDDSYWLLTDFYLYMQETVVL